MGTGIIKVGDTYYNVSKEFLYFGKSNPFSLVEKIPKKYYKKKDFKEAIKGGFYGNISITMFNRLMKKGKKAKRRR